MSAITILGAGMMGSALSVPLVDCGHEVHLVGTHLDDAIIAELQRSGRHPTLDCLLPKPVHAHPLSELAAVLQNSDEVALGVASAGVAWAAAELAPHLKPAQSVLMVSKGLQLSEGQIVTLSELFEQRLAEAATPRKQAASTVAITGPCIAGELCRRIPTCVVLSSRSAAAQAHWQKLLTTGFYQPFFGTDPIAEQTCAALKNAYAMGMAFAQGLHEKDGGRAGSVAMHNYEAAVFAQAVFEMQRFVTLLGKDATVVSGLCGVGDLNVTCNGGRTGRFGKLLGTGIGRARAIAQMRGATLECLEVLETLRPALQRFEEHGKLSPEELPLLRHLIEVALDDQPVHLRFASFFS